MDNVEVITVGTGDYTHSQMTMLSLKTFYYYIIYADIFTEQFAIVGIA